MKFMSCQQIKQGKPLFSVNCQDSANGSRNPKRSKIQPLSASQKDQQLSRKALIQGLGLTFLSQFSAAQAKADTGPFLQSSGGKGFLADEEERLYNFRIQKENDVREQIDRDRTLFNNEIISQSKNGRLCATPFGVDIVGITQFILFIGALVGGTLARQRKNELAKLNEQLRTINKRLRQTARAGTLYAPGLTYVPPTGGAIRQQEEEQEPEQENEQPVQQQQQPDQQESQQTSEADFDKQVQSRKRLDRLDSMDSVDLSMDEEPPTNGSIQTNGLVSPTSDPTISQITTNTSINEGSTNGKVQQAETQQYPQKPDQKQHYRKTCREALQAGKGLLNDGNGSGAMVRFEKAIMLAKAGKDRIQERRAVRGLAAAARLQKQHIAAIKYLERVLEISREIGEYTGDADAYGSIADIYTDMGEYEKAASYYDKYISRMTTEGQVV